MDDVIARLEELYAQLPTIECQGHCYNACGPINMSTAEHERIRDAGVDIPAFTSERAARWDAGEQGPQIRCPALVDFRCSVYEIRPLICRIWGVGRGELACLHGCKPSALRLKHVEIMQLTLASYRIGGDPDGLETPENFAELVADPVVNALMVRFTNGERDVAGEMVAALKAAQRRLAREKEVDAVT